MCPRGRVRACLLSLPSLPSGIVNRRQHLSQAAFALPRYLCGQWGHWKGRFAELFAGIPYPLYGVSSEWAPAPLVLIASVFRSCASVVAGVGPHATWEGSRVPQLPCYPYLTSGSVTRCHLTLGWPAAGVSPLCKNEGCYYLLPPSAEWKWELRSDTPYTPREAETGKWFSLHCCGKWRILFSF